MKDLPPIAAAVEVANRLTSETMEDISDALSALDLNPALENDMDFLRAVDHMVFTCSVCGLWWRQAENATPESSTWTCKECM